MGGERVSGSSDRLTPPLAWRPAPLRPFALSLSKGEWPTPPLPPGEGWGGGTLGEFPEQFGGARRLAPGVARQQVTFLVLPRKVTKRGRPRFAAPYGGTLDQPQASGAAQLALAGHTKRAPPRSSNSARLNLRLLAADRGGAQGNKKQKVSCALRARLLFFSQRSLRYAGR